MAKERPKTSLSSDRFLIIVCAHNEEKSLPLLLESLSGKDVLIIDDGSIDRTKEIANHFGATVIVHEARRGKAASLADGICYALQNKFNYVVEIGADAIPGKEAINKVLRLLKQDGVGGVSCRQIPIGHSNPAFYIDEMLWAILAQGKELQMRKQGTSHLGAVFFGFKPELVDSIEGSVNDDEQVGISIRAKGFRILFAKDVVAYFDASSCVGHVLERRKRMYFGHMKFASGTTAPSMQVSIALLALAKSVFEKPKRAAWIVPSLIVDLFARLVAWKDARHPEAAKNYSKWVTTYAKDNSLVIRNSFAR